MPIERLLTQGRDKNVGTYKRKGWQKGGNSQRVMTNLELMGAPIRDDHIVSAANPPNRSRAVHNGERDAN